MTRAFALLVLAIVAGACSVEEQAAEPEGPAQRVVTFAPHLAEMMFAVGAGERLVGVSAWSDFPAAVLDLPQVGDAFTVDQEQLSLLGPDLLLVWESGMPAHTADEMRRRGYRVESIRTRSLADVVAAMLHIGELTGHVNSAERAVTEFNATIDALRAQYRDASTISVFFQISTRPLYTVNREHFISEIIEVCGGRNVFADVEGFAPSVDIEAVLDRNPEVMLAGANVGDDAFTEWDRWPQLAANRLGNRFFLPDETIGRPSPRLAQAAQSLCNALEQARANRSLAKESSVRDST